MKRAFKPLAAVSALVAALALAAPARANSDADVLEVIRIEVDKFTEEITRLATELREKGEQPKTGELTDASATCDEQVNVRPFLPLGDAADYAPVPGGTFEDGARGWLLTNEARIVRGNSSFYATSRSDTKALSLPKGSSVTTRPMCVTELHPTLPFFVRNDRPSTARLRVEVLYEDLGGSVKVLPIAYLNGGSSWQPTTVIPLHVNLRAAASLDGTAAIAFRLTAEEEGTWKIDDLYVDPFRSR